MLGCVKALQTNALWKIILQLCPFYRADAFQHHLASLQPNPEQSTSSDDETATSKGRVAPQQQPAASDKQGQQDGAGAVHVDASEPEPEPEKAAAETSGAAPTTKRKRPANNKFITSLPFFRNGAKL